MAMSPRLDLRQSQTLVMTPQLQQAIKLLQLNNLELSAYVEDELERNPLLERDDDGREGPDGDFEGGGEGSGQGSDFLDSLTGDKRDESIPGVEGPALMDFEADSPASSDSALDVDYDNLWNNDSHGDGGGAFEDWGGGGRAGFDEEAPDLEQTLTEKISLRDHLTRQLGMTLSDPVDRLIGVHLIDMLDEAGYLVGDLSTVAEALDCSPERVEKTLHHLQTFDPPGIFARSLSECLGLQLRERNRLDPAMQALLGRLDLVARRDIAALSRLCGVDTEDVTGMIAEIRALDPKPALAFEAVLAQPITPDILMRVQPGGGWIIELNAETLPRVLVNNRYHARVSRAARNREEKQFLSECLQSANWLVKSLHQRATTILKVATEIVRQQDGFFLHGVHHLRPLVLRDIAQAIDMHESTVSRVTTNKYMASPRGIFELKYFFTSAIASASGGESHSAESVRHRIKDLIDHESANAILSDERIVEILRNEGIDIARRTVAKYREALGIPSSARRRREKALGL